MENHSDISKNFIPFELAVKLKELGFDEKCFGAYHNENNLDLWTGEYDYSYAVRAPLWQQAFDWCLDKLKFVESYAIIKDNDSYNLVIMDYYTNGIKESLVNDKTNKDCLEKLIEIMKNEKS